MKRTYRYRLYPTTSQITKMENMFSMCRHLYNWSLQERIERYKTKGERITYSEQQNALPALKKERPWFVGVYSLVLQDVLRRLDNSYQRFFRQKKGFPKYKKRGDYNSITYADHRRRPQGDTLGVSKIGNIKIVAHRAIPEDALIKTLTIIKEGGKWFACFSLDLPDQTESKQQVNHAIGIDLGVRSFLYASDGSFEQGVQFLRQKLKDLKRLQRKLSQTKKRTPEYVKVLRSLQKTHYRIRCKRTGFFYKTAYQLFAKSDLVVYEQLDIQKMVKRPLAQKDEKTGEYLANGRSQKRALRSAIYDAGWGRFLLILEHVAQKLGKRTLAVDPRYTSQKCSACKTMVSKSLSTRTHRCYACGYVVDRDLNAAKNILRLGLESLGLPLEAPSIAL